MKRPYNDDFVSIEILRNGIAVSSYRAIAQLLC